ncbi:annexin A10 [Grus japonensis]|uniref:Annexin A10 n=1 Tax=Grus japonensis TaxID=30415 RepID=A0ABC9WV58_GRUJA
MARQEKSKKAVHIVQQSVAQRSPTQYIPKVGCEKDVLIDILTQRCNSQRLMIAGAYRDMYGRDLITDLKENLSHHFKEVMVGLMYPPASYDAHELWHALKGVDTEENCLIDILASRSNMEIFQMKEAYLMEYNNDLQQDIDSETSGHFRDTLMNLAQDLGFHNKTVIRILIARSEIDLMNIRQRYKERYGKSLFHDIKGIMRVLYLLSVLVMLKIIKEEDNEL